MPARPTLAISIRQPWAWLIVAGWKTIENRTWRTIHRGPVLIHAPRRIETEILAAWPWPDIERPERDDLITGGIVGQAEIIDVVHTSDAPVFTVPFEARWFSGPYGLIMRNAQPRRFRACPGARGRLFMPNYA